MPRLNPIRILAALAALTCIAPLDAVEPIQFNRDIRPILSDNCFYCHGPDAKHREADLRLDIREETLAMKAFVPGKPDASALIDRIFTSNEDDLMPPPDSHKRLTPAQRRGVSAALVLRTVEVGSGSRGEAKGLGAHPGRCLCPRMAGKGRSRTKSACRRGHVGTAAQF